MHICALIISLLLIFAEISIAGEPTQVLLKELVRPQIAAENIQSDIFLKPHVEESHSASSILFTLEELKDSNNQIPDLVLPEDESAADVPLAINDKVEYFINYFQTKGRTTYSRRLSRSTRYLPMMKEILKKEGLPDELVYVAMIESGFHLHARSVANAVGPWQFMSATGRRYSLRIDQWIDERRDPVKATMAAAMYLKDLYSMFNNDWYLAAAGYNAGENKIFRAIGKYDTSDFWEISKGTYLKRETKEYVPKLLAAAIIAKEPARYGFTEIASVPVVNYDTVTVNSRTDLNLVAKLTGTTYQTIKELNPSLLHWCTPPNYPEFELKLPHNTKDRFVREMAAIPEGLRFTEKNLFGRYKATRRDTLKLIAKRFKSTPGEIAEINGIGSKDRLAGRILVVPANRAVDFTDGAHITAEQQKQNDVTRYYTVRKGDTLYSLARRFNVSAKLLAAWNDIKEVVVLKPGKRLIVAKNRSVSVNNG